MNTVSSFLILANPVAAGLAAAAAAIFVIAFIAAVCRGFIKAAFLTFVLSQAGDNLPRFSAPFAISALVYWFGTALIIASYVLLFISLEGVDGSDPSGFAIFAGAFVAVNTLETFCLAFVLGCPASITILANIVDPFWIVLLMLVGW